jgi:hypothetical protein
VGLLAFALLIIGVRSTSEARVRAPAAAPQGGAAAEQKEGSVQIVDGYGRDADAARERAFENARDKVRKLLTKRFGAAGWKPSDAQVSQEMLLRHQVVRLLGQPEVEVGGGERPVKARVEVQLTGSYLQEILRQVREFRVHERHVLFAHILAGLVVLLAVVGGYLRLEEATRGYYTQLLRATALLLIAATALGLWLSL